MSGSVSEPAVAKQTIVGAALWPRSKVDRDQRACCEPGHFFDERQRELCLPPNKFVTFKPIPEIGFYRGSGGGGGALRVGVHADQSLRSNTVAPFLRKGAVGIGSYQDKRVRLPAQNSDKKNQPGGWLFYRGSGGGGGSRTRVRKPFDPGSTCLATRLFLVVTPPEWQGTCNNQPQFDLTPGPDARPNAILLNDPDPEAQTQLVGSRLVFRQPVRSCRRWQLTFLQPGLTRIAVSSACPRVRPIHVEARTPP